MREVIPNVLWIGNAFDARSIKSVLDAGISIVVDLAIEEAPIQFPRDVIYCRFPLLDGEGNAPETLRSAIETTATFVTAKRPTLVACSGGMSRSPAIVCAALAQIHSTDLDTAVERVTAHGPCDFSPRLWSDVVRQRELLSKPTPAPGLNLLVIRSKEPPRTVSFYEVLGLRFQEEQHGKGPIHWAAEFDALVMEIYPAQSLDEVDSSTRLGFSVGDVESILATLRDHNVEIVSDLKQTKWGLRALVKDPDGRSVELVQ